MTARFILSLDCEGKWGVADHLTAREQATLTDERLRAAYAGIVDLLDEYAIPSTFAFVGLFGEDAASFTRLREEIQPLARQSPGYLGAALRDLDGGSREGWHGRWAVDAVAGARTDHEIALHGVTHLPWATAPRGFIEAELALLPLLSSAVRGSRTFIYPRNLVGHLDLLPRAGIQAYRLPPRRRSRLASLASELNVFSSPEPDPSQSGEPRAIPAGYFVNWQSGPRKLVPKAVSRVRVRRMLRHAAVTGEVVHFWLHPENVASAPATLLLLRDLVEEVARLREAGSCEVLTQLAYDESRLSASLATATSHRVGNSAGRPPAPAGGATVEKA